MHQWRLTKYDPALRLPDGSYGVVEWTSVGDIGKSFEGSRLTKEEYLRVEALHVEAIVRFFRASGSPPLHAIDVEDSGHSSRTLACSRAPEGIVQEGEAVSPSRMPAVIRSCLREHLWCRLEAKDRAMTIHFGYDYYVYIASVERCERACSLAVASGLFLERFASPYAEYAE